MKINSDNIVTDDMIISIVNEINVTKTKEQLENFFNDKYIDKTVLGIDIYKYSKYQILEQSLIPHLFNMLYKDTIEHCIEYENYLFQKYDVKEFYQLFISTGDGGFQLFNNPIEAITFAIYFQANVRLYNSKHLFMEVRDIIDDELTLRYTVTHGKVFSYDNTHNINYFGPAIINNARILSKDKLNRLLIDENTNKWFAAHMNSIENLLVLRLHTIQKLDIYKDYITDKKESLLFSGKNITTAILAKIGEIDVKGEINSIYNFLLQIILTTGIEGEFSNTFVITLGNSNTMGLNFK